MEQIGKIQSKLIKDNQKIVIIRRKKVWELKDKKKKNEEDEAKIKKELLINQFKNWEENIKYTRKVNESIKIEKNIYLAWESEVSDKTQEVEEKT